MVAHPSHALLGLLSCAALTHICLASDNDAKFVTLPLSRSSGGRLTRRQDDSSMQLAYDNSTYLVDGKTLARAALDSC